MKNVLILGATSDIAQAIARKYAVEGWSLTLAALEEDLLAPIVSDLKVRSSVPVTGVAFNALSFRGHQAFYDELDEKPDVVICVFGYMGDQEKARHDFTEVSRTIDINFKGAVSILNVVADDFEKKGKGVIIGISSVAGDRGRQSNYIYGCAKAGFSAYLSGLRNRFGNSEVQVMTVKPGFVRTKMTEGMNLPEVLLAEPDQVATTIYKGMVKKRNVVYTLWMWRYIMLIIKHIPEFIFKKMEL
jgi:decaprenylphospho-beta-D-erythro-pentofuranosid-2-ulose 2-reductase